MSNHDDLQEDDITLVGSHSMPSIIITVQSDITLSTTLATGSSHEIGGNFVSFSGGSEEGLNRILSSSAKSALKKERTSKSEKSTPHLSRNISTNTLPTQKPSKEDKEKGKESEKEKEKSLRSFKFSFSSTNLSHHGLSNKKALSKTTSFYHLGTISEDSLNTKENMMEGYLLFKTAKINWKRGWVTLNHDILSVFKETPEGKEVATINVLLCSARIAHIKTKKKFCFEVLHASDNFIFSTETQEERDSWINTIQQAQEKSMTSTLDHSSIKNQFDTDGKDSLKELQLLPDNQICADCDAKDPQWASVNLGIFVCLQCSGTHRSLGVHISKVRSVLLDRWDSELLMNMKNNGNQKSNTYWEAELDASWPKPTDKSPLNERQDFITAKYLYGTFLREEDHRKLVASRPHLKATSGLQNFCKSTPDLLPSSPLKTDSAFPLPQFTSNMFPKTVLVPRIKPDNSHNNSSVVEHSTPERPQLPINHSIAAAPLHPNVSQSLNLPPSSSSSGNTSTSGRSLIGSIFSRSRSRTFTNTNSKT